MSAAQSCVGFGLFSVVFDYLGGGAAQALSISQTQVRRMRTTLTCVWTQFSPVFVHQRSMMALALWCRDEDGFGRINQR